MVETGGEYVVEGFEALGTVWYVEVFELLSQEKKENVRANVESMIMSFDDTYSRFKPSSLVSRLNNDKVIPHDSHLLAMLERSAIAYMQSEGSFSVFIEQKLREKGYGEAATSPEGAVIHNDSIETTYEVIDGMIYLRGSGRIDLGGIGKGYLIDLIKERLQADFGLQQFIINGGGDMYVTHKGGEAIELYLQHPTNRDEVIGRVFIKNKSLCCSSSYVRMWDKDGKKQNHFVSSDNREIWAASYSVGDTATTADIAATVLCLSSRDEGLMKRVAHNFGVSYLVFDEAFKGYGDLEYKAV